VYTVATFLVQGLSHFVVNAEHYGAVSFLRSQPIFALGVLAMVIQGTIFGVLFPIFTRGRESTIRDSLTFAWLLGAFLVSYEALAEPGKYAVPSIAAWIRVEVSAAAVQFTLFGLLLGLVHRGSQPRSA
jgi:hypothetical protein